jgi:hypothetical protein
MVGPVGSRLITLDASRYSVVVACQCGYRCVRGTRAAARLEADRHRVTDHPTTAASLASKRRQRST